MKLFRKSLRHYNVRKDYIFLSLLFASLALGGCASFTGYPTRAISPADQWKEIDKYLKPEIIAEYDKKTGEEKKRMRNEIINARILAIDIRFAEFLEELRKEGIGYGTATDWTVIALSSAAGLVGTKALSVTAAGLTGAKASFDKNAYFEKTMPALIAQMVAHRKEVLRDIQKGLAFSLDEYPLNRALIDLEGYYNAGTIPGALTEIAKTAGEAAKKAEKEIIVFRDEQFIEKGRRERVDKILENISKLGNQKAIDLVKNPPVRDTVIDNLVMARDPQNLRREDGEVAKEMLKMMAVMGKRSDEALEAWEATLKSVEK